MTRRRSAARFAGTIVLAAVAGIACSRKPTIVHIKNESAFDLRDVALSGSWFRITTPAIAAGGMTDVTIFSRGESGLAVSFVAHGRTLSTPEQGYFEGGGNYDGHVVIKPDLSVSVEFRLAV